MDLLKKEYWWVWLIFTLMGNGFVMNVILGIFLKSFNKDQWYAKWWVWVLGFVFLIFPFFIMLIIFSIQLQVTNAAKLGVPGKELYYNPYFWLFGFIFIIVGWIAIVAMSFYLTIMILVQLYNGAGEQFIITNEKTI